MSRPWTIYYVGIFGWDATMRRGFQRLMGALADRGHNVVYIEPGVPVTRRAAPSPRSSKYDPKIVVVTPRTVPGQRVRIVSGVNGRLSRRQLARAIRHVGYGRPDIVIAHSPGRTGHVWEAYPEALRVLRNWDFLGATPDLTMVREADLILTSSARYSRMGTLPAEKTRYLPNSTDDYAPLAQERLLTPQLESTRVAGTMGTFSFSADLPLLQAVVQRCSDLKFVFQGSFWEPDAFSRLRRENVQLIERRNSDGSAVVDFLRRVSVGLCPYRRTERVLHAAPTRLLAFLRAGLPVVSTDFSPDALAPFVDLAGVFVAKDEESYSRAIYQALDMSVQPDAVRALVQRAEPFLSDNVGATCEVMLGEALETRGRR
jgi:glycosyltransferase involved in cell wall biosynthesis